MPAQIRPNRLEVTDRFPMLAFSLQSTDGPRLAEVVLASDLALFTNPVARNSGNFYSSREHGILAIPASGAVYTVPPLVLARFIAADRLYFGLATATAPGGQDWRIDTLPGEASPYVSLTGLSDRALRRVRMFPVAPRTRGELPAIVTGWIGDKLASPQPTAAAPVAAAPATPPAPVPYNDGFGPLEPLAPAAPVAESAAPAPGPVTPADTSAASPETGTAAQGLARAMADGDIVVSTERTAASLPRAEGSSSLTGRAVEAAITLVFPPLAILRAAVEASGLTIGIGPAVSAGLLAGGALGTGIIIAPGNVIGVYGSAELSTGLISSIGAQMQLTIVRGGIDAFNGVNYTAGISGGEVYTGGAAALFDANREFCGVTLSVGVGVGLEPLDIYTGVQNSIATQLGLGQGLGIARGLEAGTDTIEIKYRAFIPSPALSGPFFDNYHGDGRGFSYSGGTSRGELTCQVDMSPGGGLSNLRYAHRGWSPSHSYSSSDTSAVAGKPIWWLDLAAGAVPTGTASCATNDDTLRAFIGGSGTTVNVLAVAENASLVTIWMAGNNPLIPGSPDIDATVAVLLRRTSTGGIEAKAYGSHDGFPAHELYVNQQQLYTYDPVAAGNGPSNLIAPEDINVDTGWSTVAAAATSLGLSDADTAREPDDGEISGPVHDIEPVQSVATATAFDLTAAEYPDALVMISPNYNRGRAGQTIDRIVIHITSSVQSPHLGSWFQNPDSDASSHYMVDQLGVVRQFVSEADTAWHAGNKAMNRRSIGIEHVAVEQGGVDYPRRNGTMQHFDYLAPSDVEYATSAGLVAHLCRKYNLTPDRTTIIGHSEANPNTTHTACPNGAWDWDRYMGLVAAAYAVQATVDAVGSGVDAVRNAIGFSSGRSSLAQVRALDAGGETVEVKYRMFIPSPLILGPASNYDLGPIASGEDFGGDDRSFSYSGGTSRGEIVALVDLSAGGGLSNLRIDSRRWGELTAYDFNLHLSRRRQARLVDRQTGRPHAIAARDSGGERRQPECRDGWQQPDPQHSGYHKPVVGPDGNRGRLPAAGFPIARYRCRRLGLPEMG